MAIGSIVMAVGLVLLSLVTDPYAYLAVWALLGVAMRLSLYDAAFAALVQVTPSRGRRAISYLTLFGGFASSIFWPIGHALNGAVGWRQTLLIFAAINLAGLPAAALDRAWRAARSRPQPRPSRTAAATHRPPQPRTSGGHRAHHRHGPVQPDRGGQRRRVRRARGASRADPGGDRPGRAPRPCFSPRSRAWRRWWAASGT